VKNEDVIEDMRASILSSNLKTSYKTNLEVYISVSEYACHLSVSTSNYRSFHAYYAKLTHPQCKTLSPR